MEARMKQSCWPVPEFGPMPLYFAILAAISSPLGKWSYPIKTDGSPSPHQSSTSLQPTAPP